MKVLTTEMSTLLIKDEYPAKVENLTFIITTTIVTGICMLYIATSLSILNLFIAAIDLSYHRIDNN